MKQYLVARLIGGLGNQLFQYAAGKALAKKHNVEMKIDATGFSTYFRKFDLHHFKIASEMATEKEISFLKARNIFFKKKFVYKERGHNFDPKLLNTTPPVYLDGYWQTEKYFKDIRSELLAEFQPAAPLSTYSDGILEKINLCENSVSIHIRRGDYLNSQNQQVHGTCSLEYYKSSVEKLRNKLGELSFFIFSDDMEWAKENLTFCNEAFFIDGNSGDNSFEDMILMSHCDHNIIANSSFSWWGAWLNQNPNKQVIAPREWFATPEMDSKDIYAEGWMVNS